MKWIFTLLVLVSWSIPVASETLLAAICDEPIGPRIDIRKEPPNATEVSILRSEDKYSGTHPFFTIDSTDPRTLRYKWGNTDLGGARLDELIPQAEKTATIVIANENVISGVEVFSSNRVSVFTLLPKMGKGVFTDHSYTTVLGENVKAVTFTSNCRFMK
ncbi:hypothetical protein LPB19_12555 [Marinobacter salinisoli]|uniref:Uncharacterized protein n=1 Tax=Marinobacter salinisoli TaxID=2769486 RepID=A0ABX7MRK1_9GAMM|nr:hypothetical protein [Marinobacter salinisoli]QSP94019.1 hypothetical protein LPB19_12555 [Marinobacter salinisoli]